MWWTALFAVLSVSQLAQAQFRPEKDNETIPIRRRDIASVIRERESILMAAQKDFGAEQAMKHIIDGLGRQTSYQSALPLSDLFFIGTHNSYNSTSYGVFSGLAEQTLSLTEQLNLGIRFLMLDVKDCGVDLYAVHKFCLGKLTSAGKFRNLLEEIRRWKDKNPNETLLIDIENNNHESFDQALVQMVRETMGHFLYPAASLHSFPELDYVKGNVLFFLEHFRETAKANHVLYGTFFRYSATPGDLQNAGKASAEYTFYPKYPENLVSNYRQFPSSVSEFDGVKEQGFLVMYEGTNLAIRSTFQITPEDITEMMYSGVNIVSLDSIESSPYATLKLLAGIWSFNPFGEVLYSGCFYLDDLSMLWEEDICSEERRVACWTPKTHKWFTTSETFQGSDASAGCKKEGGEYREPNTPGDIWSIQSINTPEEIWINVAR